MAIYCLRHSKVGRSTHRAGTAGAHIRYVGRKGALSRLLSARCPSTIRAAIAWISAEEEAGRKNARVIDKLMLALPLELSEEQRAGLIRDFAERITQGRAPWLAALHMSGKDASNPHAHLVIRDKCPTTGKRVANLSDKDSTERLRALWQEVANAALARAGSEARIDHRTLEAQGVDRLPRVYEPPQAKAIREKGRTPASTAMEANAAIATYNATREALRDVAPASLPPLPEKPVRRSPGLLSAATDYLRSVLQAIQPKARPSLPPSLGFYQRAAASLGLIPRKSSRVQPRPGNAPGRPP